MTTPTITTVKASHDNQRLSGSGLLFEQQQQQQKLADQLEHRQLADFLDQVMEEKEETALHEAAEDGDADTVVQVSATENDEGNQGNGEEPNTMQDEEEEMAVEETVKEEEEVEQDNMTSQDIVKNRRRFVSYTPSPWEDQWMEQIDDIMAAKSFCRSLLGNDMQKDKIRRFLESLCTTPILSPDDVTFCFYTDGLHYMFWNKDNTDAFEIYTDQAPEALREVLSSDSPPRYEPTDLFDDTWSDIYSKFVFFDEFANEEYIEFIEPLVSHLRFPLAGCVKDQPILPDIAFHIQPPNHLERVGGRKIFYDVGSKNWLHLKYIMEEWALHNIEFDYILSYANNDLDKADDVFPTTVPHEHEGKVFRIYFHLLESPPPPTETEEQEDANGDFFLPTKIEDISAPDDYIVIKLDSTTASLKDAWIQYILQHIDELHINELFYQINTDDNYMLQDYFTHSDEDVLKSTTTSLGDAYRQLQELRHHGIRSHAWI